MQRLTVRGRLAYDLPPRRSSKPYDKRSLVATLPDDDLDLLYQWFVERRYGQALRLNRPIFGTHVTIVRHEEHVPNMQYWGKYEGVDIDVEYDVELRRHFGFWSLPVYSDVFQQIRAELGLPPEPDFHITIGRQFDWQPIPPAARRYAHQIRREREERERRCEEHSGSSPPSESGTISPQSIR